MLKKVLSLLLTVAMLASCFCCVNAAGVEGQFDSLSDLQTLINGRSVKVVGNIEVKTTGAYADSVEAEQGANISAKATINMNNVITTVTRAKTALANDTLRTELDGKDVTGTFEIKVAWTDGVYILPDNLETGNLTGFTFTPAEGRTADAAKALFIEESRVKNGNELTITIKVAEGVKVSNLADLPTEIALEYSGLGILADSTISGVVTGSTTIADVGEIDYSFIDADDLSKPIQPATMKIKVDSGDDGDGDGTGTGSGSGSGSGGGSKDEEKDDGKYDLKFEVDGGTSLKTETYKKDQVVSLEDKVPVKEGYVFDGWYADAQLAEEITSITITADTTIYAKWVKERHPVPGKLNGDEHFAYVVGYPDGTVRPNNNITRAEVTTIFFRLLNEDIRKENLTNENIFDDVNEEDWFNTEVSTMAKLGIVNGRSENLFAPNEFITRAEFTAICARFDDSVVEAVNNFTDIEEHWAAAEILEAAAYGWIEGYEDNTFRPDNFITRAEAMTLINRVLNRVPRDPEDLLDDMAKWTDNSDEEEWFYIAVQEATNSHEFVRENSVYEEWTKIIENKDWSEIEVVVSEENEVTEGTEATEDAEASEETETAEGTEDAGVTEELEDAEATEESEVTEDAAATETTEATEETETAESTELSEETESTDVAE